MLKKQFLVKERITECGNTFTSINMCIVKYANKKKHS